MKNKKLVGLGDKNLDYVASTLTRYRLNKYLSITNNNVRQALRLYILNAKVSAAVMTDLHYVEIALRNKFERELNIKYGNDWFKNKDFLRLINEHNRGVLLKAQKNAAKHWPSGQVLPPGKVVAELTFGFWSQLADRKLEHSLWVSCLSKSFTWSKAPKRSTFSLQLEKLRKIRNRVAHHEPIFHLDLMDTSRRIFEVGRVLCPMTAKVMNQTSTVQRQIMSLTKYRRRRGI
jgi:hypothetical protein